MSTATTGIKLDSTYGIWLVASFLQTILYGCGILQAWLYFQWYPKDHWGLKTMVIFLAIFESLQVTFFFASAYNNLITHFGDVDNLFVIKWMDAAQLICGFLSGLIVQLYFAYCIFKLTRKGRLVPILIVILALLSFASGLAQAISGILIKSFARLSSTETTSIIQCTSAFACDLAITVSLLHALSGHKGGIPRTNNMLNLLIITAVNRGVLTAACAALTMILFLSLPGTFWFFLGVELSSKLYMNSALATLNSREYIKRSGNDGSTIDTWHSIRLRNLRTSPQSQTVAEAEVSVSGKESQVKVMTETFTYSDSPNDHTFTDGMV